MITRDPKNELCRQLERAKDDLEFSLYIATDCARQGRATLTDNQYDEIKNNFDSVASVLNTIKNK
ncbi:hypothetical protein C942_00677 [Photobacterium marinum]|uniref:Uncharacterized protein n=2 Tax=Photobacterium marinum TaxID=1056511 RepID=L8JDI3_9GAMM|nr:hypothetical protein C942_00677 [Photobacterium marinum]